MSGTPPNENLPLENPIDEIEDAVLRDAVMKICSAEIPQEHADRSLDGAKRLLAVASRVEDGPVEYKSRRFGFGTWSTTLGRPRVVALLAASVLIAATLLVYGIRVSSEAARRMAVKNSFKQIGLAIHNYHSGYQYRLQDRNWFDTGVQLRGGTDLVYAVDQPDVSREYTVTVPLTTMPLTQDGSEKMVAHSAALRLLVDDFSQTHSKLNALVNKHAGTIASSNVAAQSGESRSGTWTILVPASKRGIVLEELAELGVLQSRTTRSSDMTEQYVDLQARIKNKEGLEKRILGLLEKHTGDIKDVIAVEEQLARVRQEIETMTAKTKNIQSVVAMTSIAVFAMEKDDYVPPKADKPPTFSSETVGAFSSSVSVIVELFKSLVLVLVLIVPWLPIAAITAYIIRRLYRSRTGAA